MTNLGENLQAEWDREPYATELWDALGMFNFNRSQAFGKLEELALLGSPLAMFNLAEIITYGMYETKRDFDLAIDWARKSAEAGSIEGKFLLAKLLKGEGDWSNAQKHFEELVDANFPIAMYALGYFYYHGDTVDRDLEKAISYFKAASKLGHIRSAIWLNYIMRRGDLGMLRRFEGLARSFALLPTVYRYLKYPKSDAFRLYSD